MIVLGVDPGLASTGWGVVQSKGSSLGFIAQGTIKTSPKTPTSERLKQIFEEIQSVIKEFNPSGISIETLFFSKNVTSALPVAQARGVVMLTASLNSIACFEFSPNEIKQAVVGVGRADKHQVSQMVQLLLGKIPSPVTDHAMDALASAICKIHRGENGV